MQGKGRFRYMNGAGYEGDWDGGVKHGVGRWMSNQKAPIRKRYPYKIFGENSIFTMSKWA